MKTFYVTGSTAGLYPDEAKLKFKLIVDQLLEMGAEKIIDVSDIAFRSDFTFKEKIDLRMAAVAQTDCTVMTKDWQESIESQLEFKENRRLNKELRFNSEADMEDIKRTLRGELGEVPIIVS